VQRLRRVPRDGSCPAVRPRACPALRVAEPGGGYSHDRPGSGACGKPSSCETAKMRSAAESKKPPPCRS
jgi:hypothetical protein